MAELPDGAAASASAGAAGPIASPPPTAPSASMANGGGTTAERDAVRDYFQVEDGRRRPLLALPQGRRRGSRHRRPQLAPARPVRMTYVELQVATHFSFLRGVSSARSCSRRPGCLAIRRSASPTATRSAAWSRRSAERQPERQTGVRLVAGCRLDLMDGSALAGLARGPRRLVAPHPPAHRRQGAGPTARRARRANASSIGRMSPPGRTAWSRPWCRTRPIGWRTSRLPRWRTFSGERGHLALTHRRRPGEAKRLHALDALARRHGLRASPPATCSTTARTSACSRTWSPRSANICTIDELGFRRERFADRYLKSAGGDGAPLHAPSPTRSAPAPTSPSAAPSRCASLASNIPTRS